MKSDKDIVRFRRLVLSCKISKMHCTVKGLKIVGKKSLKSSDFCVLRPVLLKIGYFNSVNRQIFNNVRHVKVR